jgi:hypothetical protein
LFALSPVLDFDATPPTLGLAFATHVPLSPALRFVLAAAIGGLGFGLARLRRP